MNKAQLVDALAERLGDKKMAAAAVAGLIDVVVRAVNGGDKVTITGFGVFERRARAARMARNPRTGQSVKVKKTHVPAFRPGTLFREVVSGARKLPLAGATAPPASTAPPETTVPAMASTDRMSVDRAAADKASAKAAMKAATKAAKKATKEARKAVKKK